MRLPVWLLALALAAVFGGLGAAGCSDDAAHVTYIGSLDGAPDVPRLGHPTADAGAD
jgi:hypothetical protein